ncbi:MAG: DegT/DnrJ/EryC1/StrS aminotransferase family protein [Chloroflexi bacterium]|nr:DegT/DnrJ/EryC1/StrS aminotransferase family protein [Chloroflexota bacterium]
MIPISKPYIGDAEKQAVLAVLDSGMLAQGPRVAEFEQRWARVCGVKHAIAVSSGTAALHLALLAHGIGAGDEVITTPFTFAASANSILYVGAKPVFVDIDPRTFNMDPAQVEAAITPRTRAIMPVHLFGLMCDMDPLMAIARRHGLAMIEDACQAIGAAYHGRRAGSFGTGCFSLYATKNVMTGEGGMITTADDAFARQCRLLRNHGMAQRYHHETLGFNLRMTDMQAALGLAQLDRLDDFTAKRRANADYLNAHIESVATPTTPDGYAHVWHQYTVRIDRRRDRDAAVRLLTDAGVGTGIFYPIPANQQKHIVEMGLAGAETVESDRAAREVLSLPVHPLVSAADLETIAEAVNRL